MLRYAATSPIWSAPHSQTTFFRRLVRLAPDAEEDLHSIWLYVATEAASIDIADRVIGRVLGRLPLLATPLSWP